MMIPRPVAKALVLFFWIGCLAAWLLTGCADNGSNTNHSGDAGATTEISQFGITWTFDSEATYGQFANGDYWVVGPITIVQIDPASTESDGRTMNGAMVNPSPQDGGSQGYDSAMYGNYGPNYDAGLNAARPNQEDIASGNPLVLAPNSSLVSTISDAEAGARPQLTSAAVLTVLSAAPSTGSFRPSYCGTDKTIQYNSADLARDCLAALAPVASTPELSEVERYFERPWLDHVPGWTSRYQHPSDNMPDYGREMADQVGIGALMLHLNFSAQDKETLLVRYVQLGIDFYGILQDGGQDNWVPNGGHASGRKWPILMAGILLDDEDMTSIGSGDGSGAAYFGEDGQTFHVTQDDIDMVHDPDSRAPALEYDQADIGLPEWGIRHATDPVRDNKHWEATYRRCCTGIAWSGFVLAARMMDAQELWNHDALFDYQDRYMEVTADDGSNPGWRAWSAFTEEMWDAYRDDY